MNVILILREEIVCIAVLLYLLVYTFRYVREDRFFIRLELFAIGHVAFDIVTVITVNSLDSVPLWLNSILHAVFFVFAILFCCELLRFIISIVYAERIKRKMEYLVYAVPIVFLLSIPFLRIDYLTGNGTNYSFGQAVFVGYALAMSLFLTSCAILFFHYREISRSVKRALLPGFIFMAIMEILQIFIPELLFTGADITLVTISVFFSIVNPTSKYREKAFQDSLLGIMNRNAYSETLEKLNKRGSEYLLRAGFISVVFDMNGLKQINDTKGHKVGDSYLKAAADILKRRLRTAYGIYRTGGDEFIAIYLDTDISQVKSELKDVVVACEESDMGYDTPLSVSYGYAAIYPGETVYDVGHRADESMFEYKRKYYSNSAFDRRKH